MARLQRDALHMQYRPKRMVGNASEFFKADTCRYQEEGCVDIFLFRYTAERHVGARRFAFWTACETLIPEVASAATGILVAECYWRATWRLSVDRAEKVLEFGPMKYSEVGVFYDIQNDVALDDQCLFWEQTTLTLGDNSIHPSEQREMIDYWSGCRSTLRIQNDKLERVA